MNNDNAFAIYALALVGAVCGLFSIAVATDLASLPTIAFIVEHGALGVCVRAGYKSLDGWNPIVDFLEFYGWKTPEDQVEISADALPAAA
jgi:hypothetical protein